MIIDIPMKYVDMLQSACLITADKINDAVTESMRDGYCEEFIDWGQQQEEAYRKLCDWLMYMEMYDKEASRK